jgi:Zn-dependent peptidase ImmA (M78 family)
VSTTPAEKLLQSLGIETAKEIDLEAIVWHVGAIVKRRPLDSCEALIVGNARNSVISVNSTSIPSRQRFSIAHELGHWHHHRGRNLICSGRDVDNPGSPLNPEKQADAFASDLILPNYILGDEVRKRVKRLNLKAVREIAESFEASATATLIKIVSLDAFPIIAVCHGQNGRKWFRRSPSVQGFWFPRQELDPESPAFDLLFASGREYPIPQKIGADAWFDFRGADHHEIQEQSFLLPNNEVLTLLVLPEC